MDKIDAEIKKLREEIAESREEGYSEKDLDLRISKDGIVTYKVDGKDVELDQLTEGSQLPVTLSQKEFNIARMASKLD
jgi:hypothetical protein